MCVGCGSAGVVVSATRDAAHPRVDEREVSEHVLVDAVDKRSVGGRQPRLLVDELFVEVAVVAWRRLRERRGRTRSVKHCNTSEVFTRSTVSVVRSAAQLHTSVGLKGGATCLCSRAFQSVALKKLCRRMFPFTPKRSSGSRTNNCSTRTNTNTTKL